MRSLALLLLLGCPSTGSEVVDAALNDAAAADTGHDAGVVARMDAALTEDASPRDAAISDVDAAPEDERIAIFVAYGHAARTLTSCDGRSWSAEHSFESDGHDHSAYSGLGRMAYGDAGFVACAGWGNPTRIIVSADGVNWDEIPDGPDGNFTTESGAPFAHEKGCGGIAWDGTRYAFLSRRRLWTSVDARTWVRHPVDAFDVRAFGGGDGLLVGGNENYMNLSEDGGETWRPAGEGYDLRCGAGVQRGGGILVDGDQVLITGRDGHVCVSQDRGQTFDHVAVAGGMRSMIWTGDEFVGVAGDRIHRSNDGLTWRSETHDAPDLAALAYRDDTGFVAVARDAQRFFRSDDATTWLSAASDGVDDDYLWVIVPGFGPSEVCER